ncbi:hypothetical protein [Streptococcus ruminantium]|uniref:hypothetical protein n=1 Tax=Streptococcus ruminantium TaxID=1917441 RepID=UPI0012DC74A6|nr:hypothetical protein [Streptococcus ruminantium]
MDTVVDAAQGGNISPASIGTSLAINAITEGVSSKTVKGQKGDVSSYKDALLAQQIPNLGKNTPKTDFYVAPDGTTYIASDKPTKPKQILIKSNLGNDIDITPTDNHSSVYNKAPIQYTPNSSLDILDEVTNEIRTRRYYDSNGNVLRDVDMTDHGNSKLHPEYPHEHSWEITLDGQLRRGRQ